MHLAIYPLAIGVFILLAVVSARLTQKFNARNPQLEWVLAAWLVNIISYLAITEYLHFSVYTAGAIYLVLSSFTYIYFVGVRWKYVGILNATSTTALIAFLTLFGLLPNQSEKTRIDKIAKEICNCNNMLCLRITSKLLPMDFNSNEQWAEQSKALKQCTQYIQDTSKVITKPLNFFNEIEQKKGTTYPTTSSRPAKKHIRKPTVLVTEEASDTPEFVEIREKRYVKVFIDELPKHLGENIKITKMSGKVINAKLISYNDNIITIKSKLSGGFFVMPIQTSKLKQVDVMKEFTKVIKKEKR